MRKPNFLRGLSLALALALLLAAVPMGTLAAEAESYKKPHAEILAEHVTLDKTHFEYTGEEIRPNVTVRVDDRLLTLDEHYSLQFKNNVDVGTATVIIKGRTNAKPISYSGKVEIPFYIDPKTSDDSQPELVTIIGTDVTIDGTEFTATGQPIEPGITVTVQGQQLTAGEDYTLVYENNVQPGTGSVTVTGVETEGYTGSVTIHFTINAAPAEPSEPEASEPETSEPETSEPETSEPETSEPETSEPETSEPETSEPETSEPETSEPEASEPVSYKITKGDGARWYKDSGKTLSFTVNGLQKDFESILVDGKTVNSKYYTIKEGEDKESTVITLKETFLQRLDNGKYNLTILFQDGEAEGTFKISAPVDDTNPKTGDDFALHGWTALLFVSLTGIIGTVFAFRKKLWK